jgi:hypothetical protein
MDNAFLPSTIKRCIGYSKSAQIANNFSKKSVTYLIDCDDVIALICRDLLNLLNHIILC